MSPAMAAASVGERAPDFEATGTHGNTVRLSDHRGRMVVLEWTNHECPFVRKHYGSGNMQALQRSAAEQGIRSEEHTSELQSLMRISYAVICLKKKKIYYQHQIP